MPQAQSLEVVVHRACALGGMSPPGLDLFFLMQLLGQQSLGKKLKIALPPHFHLCAREKRAEGVRTHDLASLSNGRTLERVFGVMHIVPERRNNHFVLFQERREWRTSIGFLVEEGPKPPSVLRWRIWRRKTSRPRGTRGSRHLEECRYRHRARRLLGETW